MKKYIPKIIVLGCLQIVIYSVLKQFEVGRYFYTYWLLFLLMICGGYSLSYLDNFSFSYRAIKRIEDKASRGIYHFEKIDATYEQIQKQARGKLITIDEFNFLYNRLTKIDIRTHENVTHP